MYACYYKDEFLIILVLLALGEARSISIEYYKDDCNYAKCEWLRFYLRMELKCLTSSIMPRHSMKYRRRRLQAETLSFTRVVAYDLPMRARYFRLIW